MIGVTTVILPTPELLALGAKLKPQLLGTSLIERTHVNSKSHPPKTRIPQSLEVASHPSALLKIDVVRQITGLGVTSIYGKMASGEFPAAVKIGVRCTRWRAGDIDDWLAAQGARVFERPSARVQREGTGNQAVRQRLIGSINAVRKEVKGIEFEIVEAVAAHANRSDAQLDMALSQLREKRGALVDRLGMYEEALSLALEIAEESGREEPALN